MDMEKAMDRIRAIVGDVRGYGGESSTSEGRYAGIGETARRAGKRDHGYGSVGGSLFFSCQKGGQLLAFLML